MTYLTAYSMARDLVKQGLGRYGWPMIERSTRHSATLTDQVMAFHMMYDRPIRREVLEQLSDVTEEEIALRINLFLEEVCEYVSKGFGLNIKIEVTDRYSGNEFTRYHHWHDTNQAPDVGDAAPDWELFEEQDSVHGGLPMMIRNNRPHIDVFEIADASGDAKYILEGNDIQFGIDSQPVSREIHASNLTKLDESGEPIIRPDGKILKGPNYMEPQLQRLMLVRKG